MTTQSRAPTALAVDSERLIRLFGRDDLLSLWIAEPYLPIARPVREALEARAEVGWFGYESRPATAIECFWGWMSDRHDWDGSVLNVTISPSVGTSVGALIDLLSEEGDGVIIQPPVFTDFKPLITKAGRRVIRNPLSLTDEGYRMDLDHLEAVAGDESTRLMVLCNPHNPIGRMWSEAELRSLAAICASHGVAVVSDEIHADLTLGESEFTPFARASAGTGVEWAALHGPIKTFGLAGVCDTLLISESSDLANRFRQMSSRLHLTRNNVFSLAAFETAYRSGGEWLDWLLELVSRNLSALREGLHESVGLVEPEATYLAWLDFRRLGMDVPELAKWLADAGLALSPGHWFGREGAGFARMTVAAPESEIADAINRLNRAIGSARAR